MLKCLNRITEAEDMFISEAPERGPAFLAGGVWGSYLIKQIA